MDYSIFICVGLMIMLSCIVSWPGRVAKNSKEFNTKLQLISMTRYDAYRLGITYEED